MNQDTDDTYRVWCLSWQEDEENGDDVKGYDPLDGAPGEKGIFVAFYNLSSPEEAAQEYAEYVLHHRDGLESNWPLTFRVRCPNGELHDVEIGLEYEPSFHVHSSTRAEQ